MLSVRGGVGDRAGVSPSREFFKAPLLICRVMILKKRSDPGHSLALTASTPGWCNSLFLTLRKRFNAVSQ